MFTCDQSVEGPPWVIRWRPSLSHSLKAPVFIGARRKSFPHAPRHELNVLQTVKLMASRKCHQLEPAKCVAQSKARLPGTITDDEITMEKQKGFVPSTGQALVGNRWSFSLRYCEKLPVDKLTYHLLFKVTFQAHFSLNFQAHVSLNFPAHFSPASQPHFPLYFQAHVSLTSQPHFSLNFQAHVSLTFQYHLSHTFQPHIHLLLKQVFT